MWDPSNAKTVGPVEIKRDGAKSKFIHASENILKAVDKGQIGFKRTYVRC